MIHLLNPALAGCPPASLPPAEGARSGVVHRTDDAYRFLHDCSIVWHRDELLAAWYNCPRGEIVGESCIRGRRSNDGGRTWSSPEVVAADREGAGIHYVPVSFHSLAERLLAFVSNMVVPRPRCGTTTRRCRSALASVPASCKRTHARCGVSLPARHRGSRRRGEGKAIRSGCDVSDVAVRRPSTWRQPAPTCRSLRPAG
jgi:hypothetical protein